MNLQAIIQIILPLLGAGAVVAVLFHIAMGAALFSLCRGRKLSLAWLAWLPIGQDYAMGAIVDDIGGGGRRFFSGQSCFRHILACSTIVIGFVSALALYITWNGVELPRILYEGEIGRVLATVFEIAALAIGIARVYVIYRIYLYYKPERSTLYAILSVLLPFMLPILLLTLRRGRPRAARTGKVYQFPGSRTRDEDDHSGRMG